MSVNNSIFKGDDFKLKFQMLHLSMDVLFVIWSTTIGKIVSGILLIPAFSSLLFFLSLQVLLFFLSFGKFLSAAQRGTPPWTPVFFLSFFLFFASLLFTFLFFREISILFCFFDRAYLPSLAVSVHSRNYRPGAIVELLSEKWVFLRSVYMYIYPSCLCFHPTCSREARRVRFSVRS